MGNPFFDAYLLKMCLVQWKITKRIIMLTIPAANNFAVFSLFLCRRTFARAALAFAAVASVTVAFAAIGNEMKRPLGDGELNL